MKTVRVINESRGTVLAEQAEVADTALARLRGLLGRPALAEGRGMVIAPTQSIHTMFMAFAIDVVFYDAAGTVLAALNTLRPWRISPVVMRARGVVELPAGTLARTGTTTGDRLRF